jgi:hypothetical protein
LHAPPLFASVTLSITRPLLLNCSISTVLTTPPPDPLHVPPASPAQPPPARDARPEIGRPLPIDDLSAELVQVHHRSRARRGTPLAAIALLMPEQRRLVLRPLRCPPQASLASLVLLPQPQPQLPLGIASA